MNSVFQDESERKCFICGTTIGLHEHHIFGGTANRAKSEKHGLKVDLCGPDHNLSDKGVHFNRKLDLKLKHTAQEYYERNIGSRSDFIREFGKSWL